MEDDTGVWCTGLKNGLAEEIGDVTELHSGFNVGAALDEGIEDAFDIARDIDNFLEPDWVLDSLARPGRMDEHGCYRLRRKL